MDYGRIIDLTKICSYEVNIETIYAVVLKQKQLTAFEIEIIIQTLNTQKCSRIIAECNLYPVSISEFKK